jgi:hypothetical protein
MKLLTGNRNQCQGCKEYFNSNSPFDKHRTGTYGVNRRCLTPEEMIAKGMFEELLRGFWITEKRNGKQMNTQKRHRLNRPRSLTRSFSMYLRRRLM